ncbi:putative leucine carboxyl methyltransferase [Clavispora lusitaniae]|uniref:Leucine carboxyl methyltransferase n=1 Tax=Clavispora lusitaniae TaxID=36911 RepID=A0ACD0WIP2_CLALS|nr:putative leucine carboxyl methyltransferase [Clavispora lusitaniae]QFZ33283.1 putative leucine carboxyl methyltransferase [Clavispora lusitaniae]QFZ38954.1 putative leucine carboxyl methyltransferase [Clavispora lusitaniae]QFZ44636.1 putative leucine carboxyl methyltransferase [Clavispora lusitaniae]QFZ50313.1 putative leucine carboxyl methyltransferase [Clavispora lusitaniae]
MSNPASDLKCTTMLSPKEKHDKIIRATDLDALSCRASANRKGYFVPPDIHIDELIRSYQQNLPFCEGYTKLSAGRLLRALEEPKFPLINRGTYLRTEAINRVVECFVVAHPKCQIVSLGGGSDTRCFRVLESKHDVVYTEIDFPESTKIKKLAVANSPQLQKIVGSSLSPTVVNSKAEFSALDPSLHTPRYHLVGLDLRTLKEAGSANSGLDFLDPETPTLVISECVLCYLSPEDNEQVISFWKALLRKPSFVVYEPMALDDAFGETMAQNLRNRGIDLQAFEKFPNLESRKVFFQQLGLASVLTDMSRVGGYSEGSWFGPLDQQRISRLEMIDEVEEIRLLLQHYCLICAGITVEEFSGLNWAL